MVCIYCSGSTQVVNSRQQRRSNNIWRRRSCIQCGSIFTTHESLELETAIMVRVNTDGDLEPFSRDKFFVSIYESFRHRKTAANDASALTQTILNKILPDVVNGIIDRNSIIVSTVNTLKNFDKAAAAIYDAYHQPGN